MKFGGCCSMDEEKCLLVFPFSCKSKQTKERKKSSCFCLFLLVFFIKGETKFILLVVRGVSVFCLCGCLSICFDAFCDILSVGWRCVRVCFPTLNLRFCSSASSGGGVLGCVKECRNLVCTFSWGSPHASSSCSSLLSTW